MEQLIAEFVARFVPPDAAQWAADHYDVARPGLIVAFAVVVGFEALLVWAFYKAVTR